MLPVAVHELGHLFALELLGFRVRTIRLEAKGLCIRYEGIGSPRAHAAAALAGPFAGLLYSALVYGLTGAEGEPLRLSADVSWMLSAFNLLPIRSLDGGRLLTSCGETLLGERRAEKLICGISDSVLAILLLSGFLQLLIKQSAALFAAGLWLLAENERRPL